MSDIGNDFAARMNGRFQGMLHWNELDALWQKVREVPEGWYASLIGQAPEQEPMSVEALDKFVSETDALLHHEHDYNYCGIVYADDREYPTFIKIYDPHNLGALCGSAGVPILPRWVLSRVQPTLIEDSAPLPGGRRRWWRNLFGMET